MKKIVLYLLTLGLAQAPFAQKTNEEKINELMNAYLSVNKFNGSVLVAQKGKIILEKGYGWRNAETGKLNDVHSIFQIFSITKTFTSTVILKLVELHKLSLTDKLSKFYPTFPKGDSITIEHLLSHSSGIYDYTHGNDMKDNTEKSMIDFLSAKPLDFSPGSGWSYSNSAYSILGFIIRKVSGMNYFAAVRKYIFKPLQMNESGFDFKHLTDKNKTTGYSVFTDSAKKEAEPYDSTGPFAAGAIYSTIGDLYKYHKGLQEYKIVSKTSLGRAYTAIRNNYGYGWMTDSVEGRKKVSHSGGAAGYRSNLARIPSEDICIILLNNNENANVEIITKKIFSILFDKPYKIPAEIKLPASTMEKYAGAYAVRPDLTMYISIESGRLTATASRQGKTVLLAEQENYFYADDIDGAIEFEKNDTGSVNKLFLYQHGQKIPAERIHPSWGLIGTATPNGWNGPDINFIQRSDNKNIWVLKDVKLVTGEIIFRFNNDWTIHFGNNDADNVADFLGNNIKIEEGIYDMELDFMDGEKMIYRISKK